MSPSLPFSISPMLATAMEPFDAPDYLYELKWDGIRCLGFVADGVTRLQSRNLKALNEYYPDLTGLQEAVSGAPCVVDGEIVALRDGKPSFLALQRRHNARRPETIRRVTREIPVVYMIFDLLYHQGRDLTGRPLRRRREILAETLAPADRFVLTETIPARGKEYFQAAGALGLEGVIGKQMDSLYLPGRRSRYWAKFKHTHVVSFAICGYTENPTSRGTLSALVLAAYMERKLTSFGLVGTGFNQEELSFLQRELALLATPVCPFTGEPLTLKGHTWVLPRLVCDVQYLELTSQGTLRHPLFKGLREDIRPEECTFPPGEDT